jgi:hypothetical protein
MEKKFDVTDSFSYYVSSNKECLGLRPLNLPKGSAILVYNHSHGWREHEISGAIRSATDRIVLAPAVGARQQVEYVDTNCGRRTTGTAVVFKSFKAGVDFMEQNIDTLRKAAAARNKAIDNGK